MRSFISWEKHLGVLVERDYKQSWTGKHVVLYHIIIEHLSFEGTYGGHLVQVPAQSRATLKVRSCFDFRSGYWGSYILLFWMSLNKDHSIASLENPCDVLPPFIWESKYSHPPYPPVFNWNIIHYNLCPFILNFWEETGSTFSISSRQLKTSLRPLPFSLLGTLLRTLAFPYTSRAPATLLFWLLSSGFASLCQHLSYSGGPKLDTFLQLKSQKSRC